MRYSTLWQSVRGRIDHAPDRSIPPAEFDDSDAELSDVLHTSRRPTTTPTGSTARSGRTSASDVLEIGAGHGELTERLRRDANVTASDLSKRCVDELARRFAGNDEVEVLQADVAAFGAEGRKFDAVVLVNVLEHIDDDVGALGRSPRRC